MFQICNSRCRVVERCTRDGTAPRGRAVLQMISRHFDLDRSWIFDHFSVHLSGGIAWLPNFRLAGFLSSGHESSQ